MIYLLKILYKTTLIFFKVNFASFFLMAIAGGVIKLLNILPVTFNYIHAVMFLASLTLLTAVGAFITKRVLYRSQYNEQLRLAKFQYS
jgi:hypothetical protein